MKFAFLFVLLTQIQPAWAGPHDYYECTGADGVTAYSVTRCAKGSQQRKIDDDTPPSTVDLSRAPNAGTISLLADGGGHFYSPGLINGTAMRFVVDTGATFVSLGAADAKRAGVYYQQGRPATSRTANGQMLTRLVTLDSVTLGGITLHNVGASVSENEHPVLLGMSFLKRMSVHVDGPVMTLKAR
jgi:clan AA aspartic protease (TIGR02281 family)